MNAIIKPNKKLWLKLDCSLNLTNNFNKDLILKEGKSEGIQTDKEEDIEEDIIEIKKVNKRLEGMK